MCSVNEKYESCYIRGIHTHLVGQVMPCSVNNEFDSPQVKENIRAAAAEGEGGMRMFQDTFRKLQGDKHRCNSP